MVTRKDIFELARQYKIEGTGNINQHKNDIIVLMKHFPFIYDPTDPSYKIAARRQIVWSTLAKIFKCKERQVQRRWNLLRESFGRLKACRDKQAKTIDANNRHDYLVADHPLLRQMSYLEDIVHEEGQNDVNEESTVAKAPVHEDMEVVTIDENMKQSFVASDSDCVESDAEEFSEFDKNLTVEDLDEDDNLFPDVNDVEDLLFAKLIAHELRKITCPIKKLRVQQEILKIIEKYANM